MPVKIPLENKEKEITRKVKELLLKRGLKVKELQTAQHEDGLVFFAYISNIPLSRKSFKRLSAIERELKNKEKLKVIIIPS